MANSRIAWTKKSWNPIAGCTPVSSGCLNCYAASMAVRLEKMGQAKYEGTAIRKNGRAVFTGRINICRKALDAPHKIKKPTPWFVNSMSDLFHEGVPVEFLREIFEVMNACPQHQFQILTKRPEQALAVANHLTWTPNILMGASVENADVANRSTVLAQVPAAIRFLSVEPMLGPIPELPLDGIHWVIIGCESGAKRRPFDLAWVTDLMAQCDGRQVAVFVKQIPLGKKVSHDPEQWPAEFRRREYPARFR